MIDVFESKENTDSAIIDDIRYRLGRFEDIEAITILIQEAIKEMEKHNIYQWDEIYPTVEDFKDDIEKGSLFVAEQNEKIIALYVISDESDEAYNYAEWKYPKETSFVLHRFCVSPSVQNRAFLLSNK